MTGSFIRFLEIMETLLVGDEYFENLQTQVNNHRTPSEYHLYMPKLKRDLESVQTLFDAEMAELHKVAPPADSPDAPDSGGAAPAPGGGDAPPEKDQLETLAEKWFPKTPFAALGPNLIAAERRIKRTCVAAAFVVIEGTGAVNDTDTTFIQGCFNVTDIMT